MTDATQTPPGWYDDPDDPRSQRWWNGLAWTDDRQPRPGAAPAVPPASAPAAPGYAAYPSYPSAPAAPAVPEVRRDIPTETVWIWLVVLLPIVTVLPLFFIDWRGYIDGVVRDSIESPETAWMTSFGGPMLLLTLLGYVILAAQIVFAYLDWRTLRARGVERPFHWAWIFFALVITNGVYVIGRGVILRRQTGKGLAPVWAWIVVNVLGIVVGIVLAAIIINAVVELIPTLEQYSRS